MYTARRGRRERGNTMIEFGMAFPLLFAFLIGMFQLGYGCFLYNQLQMVVRTGARYASIADFDSASSGASFRSNVANMVVYGNPSGGTRPLVTGLRTSLVSVTWQADGAGIPQTVTVKISSYSFSVLGKAYQLTNKPQATFIYLGQFLS
jgi:Flp pilus assembly protein TadG